ncbi:fumarylacetoacetate hydrolase family protein [Curtobacterium sp. NPDC090217]|uniref:fumarylacetoacetate hydrolase family protein n=1 Tax=Curtobacterium sp. NPDC090217 TaxID=3363970 RepID=UPI0038023C59
MRIARISTDDGPRTVVADGDEWVGVVSAFDLTPTGARHSGTAALLAPIEPGAIVGISHPTTADGTPRVQGWWKSPRTLGGPGATIHLNEWSDSTVGEGELAVVIGSRANALKQEDALAHVLGYTVANDVTVVAPLVDSVFFAAKVGENATPLGPWIETDLPNPDAAQIEVRIDGDVVLTSSTAHLPNTVSEILVAITEQIVLEAGDVVLTGSPQTAAELHSGRSVDITITGVGTLRNTVS